MLFCSSINSLSVNTDIKKEGKFEYIETGQERKGETPLLLLHGLMGALSNFESILEEVRG